MATHLTKTQRWILSTLAAGRFDVWRESRPSTRGKLSTRGFVAWVPGLIDSPYVTPAGRAALEGRS